MDTAILLLVFNRPHATQKVLDSIRQVKPPRLYVAADGPRKNKVGEKELCDEVRKIATTVDWACEVKTLFREENLKGFRASPQAIDWFFEQEESGIILEDDCAPSRSFYFFCQDLLAHYWNDERIMSISGNNFLGKRAVTTNSYFFSRYSSGWGWATWRRAWKRNLKSLDIWHLYRKNNCIKALSDGNKSFEVYWYNIFDRFARGEIDHWDYRWLLSCWAQNGLTATPVVNLVTNIGFGPDATHTQDPKHPAAFVPAHELEFPLKHPRIVCRNVDADALTDQAHFGISPALAMKIRIRARFPSAFHLKSLITKAYRAVFS